MKKKFKVPYGLKKLALGAAVVVSSVFTPLPSVVSAVSLLGAAVVALPVFTSCEKDKPEPQKHDVTIVFGPNNCEGASPEKVRAAAAPNDVRNVILESDGKNSGGASATALREDLLQAAFNASEKTVGKGNLLGVGVVSEQNRIDSLWLVQKGFTFVKLR